MKKKDIIKLIGTSMRPLSRNNDLAIVMRQKRYNLFDVVLFRDKKKRRWILHRIVRFRRDGKVTLHGDNNASFFKARAAFEVGDRREIRSRLAAIIRNGRMISGFRLKIFSAFSFFLGLVKLLPFLIKKYVFRIKR